MRTIFLVIASTSLALLGARPATQPAYIDALAFLENYRIQHYLECGVEFQTLEPGRRADRLKALAVDPKHASEVYPLCRMLFAAKPNGKFRGPQLGVAGFIDGGDSADWHLEPITIFENVPILIVSGYGLGGEPEAPEAYVEYCLEECVWRDTKFQPVALEKRKEMMDRFLAANPKLKENVDGLRRQVE